MSGLAKNLITETLSGKTIWRVLFNHQLEKIKVGGEILDLGAGTERSSYFRFLKLEDNHKITSIDITNERKPDIIANLEEGIPLPDNSFGYVMCFNLLEHIYDYQKVINETYRVLKPQGVLIGTVPFVMRYHADPSDYFRYTHQALKKIFEIAGFKEIIIKPLGYGPFVAGFSQIEYLLPGFIKIFIIPIMILLDKLLLKIKKHFKNSYVLGYLFEVKK
ncbi:MAG: class I SAM-dependent methyltransferase [bacterium]